MLSCTQIKDLWGCSSKRTEASRKRWLRREARLEIHRLQATRDNRIGIVNIPSLPSPHLERWLATRITTRKRRVMSPTQSWDIGWRRKTKPTFAFRNVFASQEEVRYGSLINIEPNERLTMTTLCILCGDAMTSARNKGLRNPYIGRFTTPVVA